MYSTFPKVITGEALTSYLLRTAVGNGTDVITILNNFKTRRDYIPQRWDISNIDLYAPATFDTVLFSETFQLNHNAIQNMTFYNALTKFTIPTKVHSARFLNGIVRRTFHYCPSCLREKKFLSLKWRVSALQFCDYHQCKLLSSCPSCRKTIVWSDVDNFEQCPYCDESLFTHQSNEMSIPAQDLWYSKAWDYLLSPTTKSLFTNESPSRLVYLLNEYQDKFDRKIVEKNFVSIGKIQNLLQYARGTWRQDRIMHIDLFLKILYHLQISVETIFNLEIPDSFRETMFEKSLHYKHNPSGNYGNRIDKADFRQKLINLCSRLYNMDIPITQSVILKELVISENTLHKLGYTTYIHDMKKKQQEKLKQVRVSKMIEAVDQFFIEANEEKVLAKQVYEYLGVYQSYLCDYAPEVIKHIETKRSIYNNSLAI